MSIAATLVMTITLVIFASLFLLFSLTNYSLNTIQDKVDVSVYFTKGLPAEQIGNIRSELSENPKIKEIEYTSALEAYNQFKERHKDDPQILESLNELNENPLPATLNIKAFELEDYPEIAESLQSPRYEGFIETVSYENTQPIIERLSRILNFVVVLGIAIVIVFSIIAILVIYNTITLTIHNRREEIEIMRLVGATNWYIRGPFVLEAVLYSIFATVITSILALPLFVSVLPKIALFINPQLNLAGQNIFSFWFLAFLLLAISVILAVFSTLLAIRRYLKI